VERLKVEISELHKSKCQSLELIEQRDAEIKEKDGIIQSYYDKIVSSSVKIFSNQSIWQPYT
jgi:nucleoprotein TPR